MKPLLIYLQPWRTSTAARVDMRAGDCPAAEGFGIGGFEWEPIVTSRPVFSIELMSPDLDGKVQAGKVKLTLALRLVKNLPDALTLDYQGAPITIWSCDTLAWDRALVELTGTVTAARLDVDTGQVQIDAEVSTTLVEKPLLTLSFSGGGGLLGDTGKRGVLRPAGFGIVEYIEPVWFDETYNIGQIDGYGNTLSVQRVMEGANDLGASVGDYANYAALQAAIIAKTIPPGRWGTCLADGLIGMGAPPAGVIGVNATFGYGKPGSMMQRIVQFHAGVALGSIDTAAFTALTAQVEAVLGGAANIGYWTKDQRQVNDLLQAMAQSCNATPLVSFQGLVTVTRAVASAPVATLDRSGSVDPRVINWKSAQSDAPYFQLRARTARPARVLTRAEIFAEDDLNDKGPWNATTGYRLDNTVFGADGAEFIYINATPTVGPALPTSTYPPAAMASNAYWQQLTRPPPLTGSQLGVADGATADLKLTDIGSQSSAINGNSFSRNAGSNDFNACVRSGSIQGPQYAEVDILAGAVYTIINLDDDAPSYLQAAMLLQLQFVQNSGAWAILLNNVTVYSGALGATTGKLRISYDGIRYRCYANATQLGSDIAASASNLVLWAKWTAYQAGVFTGLRSGPYTANIWPDIDGPGKPADNAGTTVALTSLGTGTYRVIGNSYTKTATNAVFDTALRGPAMTGAIYCEMDINPASWNMVGFDASATTYDRANAAFFVQYDPLGGGAAIYVGGTLAQSLTPGAAKIGKLTITYDGVRYRAFLAGAQIGTDVAASAGLTLYPKWYGYSTGTYTGLSAGQGAGSNLWGDVGGVNVPANNAGTSGVLTALGLHTVIVGNTVYKNGGTHGAYEGGAVGQAQAGSAFLTSSINSPVAGGFWITFLALDDDGTSYNLGTRNPKCYLEIVTTGGGGYNAFLVIGGVTAVGVSATGLTANSRATVAYDGVYFYAIVDGVLLGKAATTAGLKLWPKIIDFYINGSGAPLVDVLYGPFTQNDWTSIGGAGKPSDNATTDLVLTAFGSQAGTIVGNTFSRNAGVNDFNSAARSQLMTGACCGEMDIVPGGYSVMSLDTSPTSNTGASQSFYVQYDSVGGGVLAEVAGVAVLSTTIAAGIVGKIQLIYDRVRFRLYVGGTERGAGFAAPSSTLQLYAKWFDFSAVKLTGLAASVAPASNLWGDVGGTNVPADNADVTADNLVTLSCAPSQGVAYDYTITAKTGELTRDLTNFLKKGGADISSSATWSFTPSGCTITAGSNGVVTLNTVSATDAAIAVSAVYGGKTYTGRISITKRVDLPPAGGTAATSFSGSAAGTVNETAYTTPIVLGTGTMRTNGSGQARLNCTINYSAPLHKSLSVNVKWQKSLMGANTWSDTTLSGTGTAATGSSGSPDDYGVEGSAVTNTFATGLTASTDYDFRLVALLVPGTGAPTTVAVEGTISGSQT